MTSLVIAQSLRFRWNPRENLNPLMWQKLENKMCMQRRKEENCHMTLQTTFTTTMGGVTNSLLILNPPQNAVFISKLSVNLNSA